MKVLIVGLGSMGRRRVRNLQAIGSFDILGFDIMEVRRNEAERLYGIKIFADFENALKTDPDVLIISVPPHLHMLYAHKSVDAGKPCFIEASVTIEDMPELIQKVARKSVLVAPSCTMRFHPSIKKVKELVDTGVIGKPCNFSYHFGHYLPDWHPWEKVTDFYVSRKETGAAREMVAFELTWITWVLGDIERAAGYFGALGDVGADIDDTYVFSLMTSRGVLGSVVVDILCRYPQRTLLLVGDKGQIHWDWNKSKVAVYDGAQRRWTIYKDPEGKAATGYNANIIEEMYVEELKTFFYALEGRGAFPNTLEQDLQILHVLHDIEEGMLHRSEQNIDIIERRITV